MPIKDLPKRLIHAPLRRGQNVLFPPACLLCRAVTDAPGKLCPECWSQVGFLDGLGCRYCARPIFNSFTPEDSAICDDCLRHSPIWTSGAAVFLYRGAGRRLVLGLKHGDRQDMIGPLATWATVAAGDLLTSADAIIPVPLHWTRRLKRRGNHAAWLARAMAVKVSKQKAFQPQTVLRTRKTSSQDGKSRTDRIANLRGAFSAARGGDLSGQRVLLVDDVLTTGATLNAVTQTCLQMGAARVDICVLALVPRDEHDYMASNKKDEENDPS